MNPYKISDTGLDLIKHFEGLRLYAYQPVPGDHWTIGYGSTRGVYKGLKITKEEAEVRLREDVGWAERAVVENVHTGLSQNQFDSLVSFVFNTGVGAFKSSTLLRELNKGNYEAIDHQLSLWVHGGRPKQRLDGLVRRRKAEADLFDDYPPRLDSFTNHASIASHKESEHTVTQTLAESRTAKSGAVIAGVGGLDGGITLLEKLSHASDAASGFAGKFSGLLDPSMVIPLAAMVIGIYIIWLKNSDKKGGRSY